MNPINSRVAAQLKPWRTVLKTYPTVSDKNPHNGIFVRRNTEIFCGDTATHLKQYTTTKWFT